jgi:hypothetical protein
VQEASARTDDKVDNGAAGGSLNEGLFSAEPVQEEPLDNGAAGGSFTLVKRRGRPPGAKNKVKADVKRSEIAQKQPAIKVVEPPEAAPEPSVPEVPKESAVPETKLFTQQQVEQLLLNSFKLQEQKTRDEKRERYAALFRKQKWTVR